MSNDKTLMKPISQKWQTTLEVAKLTLWADMSIRQIVFDWESSGYSDPNAAAQSLRHAIHNHHFDEYLRGVQFGDIVYIRRRVKA